MATATDFFDPALRSSPARLAVAVELMRELSRYSDPAELSSVFARRMNQLYPTSRQITLTRRGVPSPKYRVTRFNLWPDPVDPYRESHRLPILEGGFFGELIGDDQPRVVDHVELAAGDPARDYLGGEKSLLSIPIFDGGKTTSALILTREEPNAFAREQVPELVWLTNLFARAAQTLVLSRQLQEAYDTSEYELRSIEQFQQKLLPESIPSLPGLDIAVHYRTAHRAGGDYYDFFPLPGDKLGILLIDISGHGSPAAMLMAVAHSLVHAYPEPAVHPGAFLTYLNHALSSRYTVVSGNFATAIYGVVDRRAGTWTFANAGHEAPRLRRRDAIPFQTLDLPRRLPLGVSHRSGLPYPEQIVRLERGDYIALFTDGIIEAESPSGEPYGLARLDAHLAKSGDCAECMIADVVGELEAFTGSPEGTDDRTLVLLGLSDFKVMPRSAAGAVALSPVEHYAV